MQYIFTLHYTGFPRVLENPGKSLIDFFLKNFLVLESSGKWDWSWKVLEVKVLYGLGKSGNFQLWFKLTSIYTVSQESLGCMPSVYYELQPLCALPKSVWRSLNCAMARSSRTLGRRSKQWDQRWKMLSRRISFIHWSFYLNQENGAQNSKTDTQTRTTYT